MTKIKHRPLVTMTDADLSAALLSIAQDHSTGLAHRERQTIAEAAVRVAVDGEDRGERELPVSAETHAAHEQASHGSWSWTDEQAQDRTERTRPHPMFGSAPSAYDPSHGGAS